MIIYTGILINKIMKKIRYKEINRNKYEIILPNHSSDPIGYVYYDILKKRDSWYIRPYFVTLYKSEDSLKSGYEDFAKAGRSLVDLWEYTMYRTSAEITADYNMDDLFKLIRF